MSNEMVPIWSVIEGKCSLPATIAVIGASDYDDVVSAGRALAEAASMNGRTTGLVVLDPTVQVPMGDGFDVVTLNRYSRELFDDRRSLWCARYDVLVVAVPRAVSHVLGPHTIRAADGVVIALAAGRRIEPADRVLSNLIEQLGATTIGIVRTAMKSRPPVVPPRSSFQTLRRTLRSLVFRT